MDIMLACLLKQFTSASVISECPNQTRHIVRRQSINQENPIVTHNYPAFRSAGSTLIPAWTFNPPITKKANHSRLL